MRYYNTTNETGQTLLSFEASARSQEETVLNVFKTYSRPFSWSEVKSFLPVDMNEVSIKRSITNLFKAGHLQKTDEKVKGIYGKNCYRYKLI
jgi:hypothetical protein